VRPEAAPLRASRSALCGASSSRESHEDPMCRWRRRRQVEGARRAQRAARLINFSPFISLFSINFEPQNCGGVFGPPSQF
jgi:hypothetical protein